MNTTETINKALPIFLQYRNLEDEDLLEVFIKKGFAPSIARKIIVFTPMAFGRIVIKDLQVETSNEFEVIERKDNSLHKQRRKLNDVEIYRESFKMASAMPVEETMDETFLVIAYRSAEVNAVNQMKMDGVNPENIVFTSMATMWEIDEEPPQNNIESHQANEVEEVSTKNWWEFWK